MKKNVVYIVSNVQKSLAFEWIANRLSRQKYNLEFILLNPSNSGLEKYLKKNRHAVVRITYRGKRDFIPAFFKLLAYFLIKRPAIVHAHLFDAQLLGLTAAWLTGIRMRIYTRHNSNYHQVYFPNGVKYDRWSNHVATHIVSISQSTHKTLLMFESVNEKKIKTIHHGFDLSVFKAVSEERKHFILAKWKIPQNSPCIIGVIARHIEWKGVQYIIPAFKTLLMNYPSAVLVLANASGPYHKTLMDLMRGISQRNYVIIPFEDDIAALYSLFTIYVHTPVDSLGEAFGQTYVEALAAGVPSIFTLSGVAVEFIEHGQNAWVVDYRKSDAIYEGMKALLENRELQRRLKETGQESVQNLFNLDLMLTKLEKLYDE